MHSMHCFQPLTPLHIYNQPLTQVHIYNQLHCDMVYSREEHGILVAVRLISMLFHPLPCIQHYLF